MALSNIDLGKYLKSIRENLGYSTYDVKKFCGISQSYLSLMENGKRTPSAFVLKKLAPFYEIDYLDLYKKAGYIDLVENNNDDLFELKITDDSMSPVFIEDDIVIIKRQVDFETGDIVAVCLTNDEVIIRKIIQNKNGFVLQAFNTVYEPLIFTFDEMKNLPVNITRCS